MRRKVNTRTKQDAYITKTPKAIAQICTERCPYPTAQCGANGCDFFKAEKARLILERKKKAVKGRWKEDCT